MVHNRSISARAKLLIVAGFSQLLFFYSENVHMQFLAAYEMQHITLCYTCQLAGTLLDLHIRVLYTT